MSERLLALQPSSSTRKGLLAILPIGSLENHGSLPLGTDTLIAECVSVRAASLANCSLVVAPPIAYSVSVEHENPRATSTPETFIKYLVEVAGSLAEWLEGLLIAVFHGGVFPAAYMAARVLRAKGQNVAVFNAWQVAESFLREKYGVEPGIIHADPVEASILTACGYPIGVEDADPGHVLKHIRVRRPLLLPWVSGDIDGLYPERGVPASRALGEELVEAIAKELSEYACRLARRNA